MTAASATDATFDEVVLRSAKPVLVDFWAPWCGPCRQLGSVLDQIHAAWGECLGVVKVNTDEEPMLGRQFAVTSLPTVILFDGGVPVMRFSGAQPKHHLMLNLAPWLP